MMLEDSQQVISMLVAAGFELKSVLTATENGFGKRTPIAEYTRHGQRATKRVLIAIQTSGAQSAAVAAVLVEEKTRSC